LSRIAAVAAPGRRPRSAGAPYYNLRIVQKPSTRLVTLGRDSPDTGGFVNPPVVRGSTVLHPDAAELRGRGRRAAAGDDRGPPTYGIHGTPTHHAFLDAMTALEGGFRSWAVPSGLSACTVAVLAFVRSGDHVLVPDSAYGPTRDFCRGTLARYGIEATFYDPRIGAPIENLFRPETRLLFLESPGSLTFEIQDVPLLAQIARRRGAVSVIDNTWATPLFFQPLAHGVDVSVHAVTKYIGGHADLLLGTITCKEACAPPVRALIRSLGLTTSPDECWMALRGLRTLEARLARHRATAERIIDWLRAQPEVERVLYPALPDDPGHALWRRDFSGATGVFGFALRPPIGPEAADALVDGTRLFGRGYSWGGFESLMIPCHPERSVAPLPYAGRLLRISAGLEDADDLVADLHDGFGRMRAAQQRQELSK
jgi:cystathionine beta-lyase